MNKSPDIFKGKEQEFKTRFEKDGYNWEEVKSKLESVERDEQIDRRLTELEGKTEDYYNYLKGLIDKQISENSSEKPKEKEDDKKQDNKESFLSNAKEKAKQKVIEEAEKKGGFYGKIAKFFLEGTEEKETDGFGTKIWNGMKIGIGMAILGWFGIKGLETTGVIENAKDKISSTVSDVKTTVDSAKSTLTDTTNSVTSTVGNISQEVTKTIDNTKNILTGDQKQDSQDLQNQYNKNILVEQDNNTLTKQGNENLQSEKGDVLDENKDTLKDPNYLKYKGGFHMLLGLSGENYENGVSTREYMELLKNVKYEDLQKNKSNISYFYNYGKLDNEILINNFPSIINSIGSENVDDLLRIGLKKESLEKILMGKDLNSPDEKIKNYFGESRFQEILSMIKNNSYDYKKLTVGELSYLYSYTMPIVFGGALSYGLSIVGNYLPSSISGISEELKQTKEDFFSEKLLGKVGALGKEKTIEQKDKLLAELSFSEEKDIQDFGKLFEFRNYILGDFLNEKVLSLNEQEKEIIKKELKYSHIIVLYSILGGGKISETNEVNIPLIVGTLFEIIKNGDAANSNVAGNYFKRYLKKVFVEKNFLTPDQEKVLEIYGKKFMEEATKSYQNQIGQTLGFFGINKNNALTASLASGGAALGIHFGTKAMINKGIQKGAFSLVGLGARRLIKPLGIASVLLGGAHFVLNDNEKLESDFQKNLKKSYDDGNIGEYTRLLNEFEKSISIKEVNIDGKKENIGIIAINGESPLIIRGNQVFTLGIINDDKFKQSAEEITLRFYETDAKFNGKDIYPIKVEGEYIIFGDNLKRIPIKTLLVSITTEKTLTGEVKSFGNDFLGAFGGKPKFSDEENIYFKLNGNIGEFGIGLMPLFEKQ